MPWSDDSPMSRSEPRLEGCGSFPSDHCHDVAARQADIGEGAIVHILQVTAIGAATARVQKSYKNGVHEEVLRSIRWSAPDLLAAV